MSEIAQRDTLLSFINGELTNKACSVAIQAINVRGQVALEELSFPTKKDEDWRFTDLDAIKKNRFHSISDSKPSTLDNITEYILPEAVNTRLVFVNGTYNSKLSSISELPNHVIVGNMNEHGDHEASVDLP